MTSRDPRRCCEAVRSATLATWLLVIIINQQINVAFSPKTSLQGHVTYRRRKRQVGPTFLADRTNGRFYATVLRLSVVCL